MALAAFAPFQNLQVIAVADLENLLQASVDFVVFVTFAASAGASSHQTYSPLLKDVVEGPQ